jgi:hypothetical protein
MSQEGRDLPDANGPEFLALNGGFGEACRSAAGHRRCKAASGSNREAAEINRLKSHIVERANNGNRNEFPLI